MSENKVTGNIKPKSWIQFLVTVGIIILIGAAAGLVRIRLDLTEDKRYTLSPPTRDILNGLENDVYIQVYFDGEIPIPLKRLKRSVQDLLEEFRIESGRRIDYEFINPADAVNAQEREARYSALVNKGLSPVNIMENDEEGGSSRKMIFPGMIVNYNGVELPLDFLKKNEAASTEQNILHSIEGLEYEMIQAISTITSDTIYRIAFLEGHGEYEEIEVADITRSLAKYFTIDRGKIGGREGIMDHYSAVIIAGPTSEFSEADKLVIDQYIMNGGKVLWIFEEVAVNTDSLAINGETVGLYYPLNIEDQLFRYGARVNPELVQDIECMIIPLTVLTGPENTQIAPAPWLYYPRLYPKSDHPVTRNLNKVKGMFVNTIDTVGLDPAIRKTVLLTTSEFSRTLSPPLLISLKEIELNTAEKDFDKKGLTVALLLEGVFPSAFKNRMTANLVSEKNFTLKTESTRTKMIVIADGDIIRNDVQRSGTSSGFFPINKDRYTGELLANRDFLVNCINYLVDDNRLMELRSREVKMRLLDKSRVKTGKVMWQIVNVAGPVLIVILAGVAYSFFRRRKYTRN
jgi:gliding-associated putative ABC transporter substrate-binding component GldG